MFVFLKFGVFCFVFTSASRFALLLYYQQHDMVINKGGSLELLILRAVRLIYMIAQGLVFCALNGCILLRGPNAIFCDVKFHFNFIIVN